MQTMANLNKWYGIGRLTQDPEIRHSPRGNQIVTLHLAINRDTKDQNGNKQKETCFLDVVCLGKTGELAAQYLSKGRECMVEGRLRMQTWQDKQTGQQRSKIDILADNLQFLGGGAPMQQPPAQQSYTQQEADEDILF